MTTVLPRDASPPTPPKPSKKFTQEELNELYTSVNRKPRPTELNKITRNHLNKLNENFPPVYGESMREGVDEVFATPTEILPIIDICRKTNCKSKFNLRRPRNWEEGKEEVDGEHVWTIEGVKKDEGVKKEKPEIKHKLKVVVNKEYEVKNMSITGKTKEELMDNFKNMYGDKYQDCLQTQCPRIDDVPFGKKRRTMKKNKNKKTLKGKQLKKKTTKKTTLRKRRKSNKKK